MDPAAGTMPLPGPSWVGVARRGSLPVALAASFVLSCSPRETVRTPTPVALAVGIEDDGVTFELPAGGLVELRLPADSDWSLEVNEAAFDVVEQDARPNTLRRWLLRSSAPGTWQLRATGTPICLPGSGRCPPARRFQATFTVR